MSLSRETVALLQQHGFEGNSEEPSFSRPRQTVLVRAVSPRRESAEWILADRRLLDAGNWDLREIYSDGP
jgi:hypothetical protein